MCYSILSGFVSNHTKLSVTYIHNLCGEPGGASAYTSSCNSAFRKVLVKSQLLVFRPSRHANAKTIIIKKSLSFTAYKKTH